MYPLQLHIVIVVLIMHAYMLVQVAENATQLSERSALSDLFKIRHVDGFPSINGYRLGRAPDDKRRLHWNEINAAWGEVSFDRLTGRRFQPLLCLSIPSVWFVSA